MRCSRTGESEMVNLWGSLYSQPGLLDELLGKEWIMHEEQHLRDTV